MGVKVTNNAYGTLSAGIASGDTTITLDGGQGARFPTLGAGDYFYGTLVDTSNNIEVVKVTARSTDSMTVVRGVDNTTARAYVIGDRFELRPTAALFEDLGQSDILIDSNGDTRAQATTAGVTVTGALTAEGVEMVPLAKAGDIVVGDDYDSWTPNSISYQVGTVTNRPNANNGMVLYTSTLGLDGTHDDATNERAFQLYAGDSHSFTAAGLWFRIKQGTTGWHDWARIMHSKSKGAVIQTAYDTTDAITTTTSQSGFVALEAALTPQHASSRMLVISNVFGAAADDSHAWLEYKIGTGSWTRNTNLNGSYNGGAAMGDFSYSRDDVGGDTNDAQTGYGTSVIWHPNTTSEVRIRVICSAENNTGGGFRLNIGRSADTAGSYNNTTTKSTLVIQEIAWE